jgi:hypothetical protein
LVADLVEEVAVASAAASVVEVAAADREVDVKATLASPVQRAR